MKITLLLCLIFFNIQNIFAMEFIKDTEIYKLYKNQEIEKIIKKTKKSSDKQFYLEMYLAHYNKIKNLSEKLIFITIAQEFAYKNKISIDSKYYYDYEKIIIDNLNRNKDLTCYSLYFYYSIQDNFETDFETIPNIFIDECEYIVGEDYHMVLLAIMNITTSRYLDQSNAEIIINKTYDKISKKAELKMYADFHLGSYAILSLNKQLALEQILKFEESNTQSPHKDYLKYLLKLNYMTIYENKDNIQEYLSIVKKLDQHIKINSLQYNKQFLEHYIVYISHLIENNVGEKIIKNELEKIFSIMENNLSKNDKKIMYQYLYTYLSNKPENGLNIKIKEYILTKIEKKNDVKLYGLNNYELISEIDELFDKNKYSEIIDKIGYLGTKQLTLFDTRLVNKLLRSYVKKKDLENASDLLLKNYEIISKKWNDFESYTSFKADFENILDSQIYNSYIIFKNASEQDKNKEREIAINIFFNLSQIKNFNEVSNSVRSANLKILSKFDSENMNELKEFIDLEKELIQLNLNDNKNYELISKKNKILKSKIEDLQKMPLYSQFHKPININELIPFIENGEVLINFIDTKRTIYAFYIYAYNNFYFTYIHPYKKEQYNLYSQKIYSNINNFVSLKDEFDNIVYGKNIINFFVENEIKNINIINSVTSSNLVYEAIPYKEKYLIDYFSINYSPSIKHFINLRNKNTFKLGLYLNESSEGLLVDKIENTQYSKYFLKGDVIVKLNNVLQPTLNNLDEIKKTKEGEYLKIVINRNNKEIKIDIQNKKKKSYNYDFVGFGNPDYSNISKLNNDLELTTNILRSTSNNKKSIKNLYSSLYQLEETAEEIIKASENFSSNKIYLDKEASEKNFYSLNEKKIKILSIATHAIEKNSDLLIEPALVLSYDEEESDLGLLTSNDINSINLDVELVILSACNTSAEGLNSELLFSGLARAFLTIGAENLIISRWPVESVYTTEFMNIFYTYINDFSYRDAFYMAQRDIKKIYPDPYYWSSFMFLGI